MANLRANRITSTEVFETTGSVQFDGTGDRLTLNNSNFVFGTGDCTIEGWGYVTSHINYRVLATTRPNNFGYADAWHIGCDVNGTLLLYSNAFNLQSASNAVPTNQWFHWAFTRNNGTGRLFVNGEIVASGSVTNNYARTLLGIGDFPTSQAEPWSGHISNLRVLKGQALYTENFTPPTRELEVIPNTVLLACQSTTNAAEEKTGKTITVNGNAVANELTPGLLTNVVKSGGSSAITGSVEFDGSGDYLSLSSNDFAFGTGDFTLEFWFYDASPTSGIRRWVTSTLGAFGSSTFIIREQNGSIGYLQGASTVTYPKSNSWSHIAYTRESGIEYIFYNGVLLNTAVSDLNYTDTTLYIGGYYNVINTEFTQGFISNLRIIKGTALYTSNFIPPTRKLTKLPGTVLLCCQDSNDPTTEATGKTITGYGDLEQDPPELVTDGGFDSAANWPSAGADWTISGGVATISSADSGYDFLGTLTSSTTNGLLYELTFDISNWTAGRLELAQSDSSNIGVTVTGNGSYTFRFRYTGTTNGNISLYAYTGSTSSFTLDNVSLKRVSQKRKGSNFTPSVGSDGSVEFAGPTTINTENYFYLPTGPTEQRGRGRGVFGGGSITPLVSNVIDYITIASTGNSIDFGDLTQPRSYPSSCSSSTRGVFGGGISPTFPTVVNTLDYITIASTGNSLNFGDLRQEKLIGEGACSSSTRGVFGGGYNPSKLNAIDYITIASTGDAQDFGDLTRVSSTTAACSSSTRGVFAGGNNAPETTPGAINVIDYITIASVGNASDFGDLIQPKEGLSGASSSTRGVFAGGYFAPTVYSVMDYITIASTGNALDFGDLSEIKYISGSCSSSIRGVFGGGGSPILNSIDYVTIASTGNSQDFGDLSVARTVLAGCSDSHGGLG